MSLPSKSAKDIFLMALDVAPSGRAALLDDECNEDAALRRQVEALLKVHDEPDSLLDSSRIDVGISRGSTPENSPTLDQPITEKPGTQIGPYKLIQQIGEGGMGVVYMAEQKKPVKRRVAIKIIKPGMDTRQVIARFEAERQALALMDHPNIAKVLDAGQTDSGKPYFVMELVKGMPVTKYCDEQHLTPKERLELFVPICQAVQHAHHKGIIHRDLKPSNILVAIYDGQPVPKIIDFGVAKATSQTLTEKTMFTQVGQVVGTLEYMSPEQAERNQLDIDTRSDIYSLGVVLYELLTGETPFDRERLRSAAFDEMLRIIREEEPSKPSTKVSSSHSLPSIAANRRIEPAKLGSMIRGELDWIVLKAMEKDRGRRYETASKFAEDVQHYLNDEAVVACPPSRSYKFRKFARRNKAAIGTTLTVAAALLLGLIGTSWQAYRATQAEQLATDRFLAEQTAHKEAEQARGAEAEQRATAERERDRAQTNLELATTERQRAEGNLDLALAALDAVYLEAIGKEKLLGEPVAKPEDEQEITLITPAPLTDMERELVQRGLKFYDQFAGQNADADRVSVQAAHAFYRVGLLQAAIGDRAAAQAAYREAIARYERLTKEEPDNPTHFINLAESRHGLANVLSEWNDAKKELERARQAVSLAIEIEPERAEYYILRSEVGHRISDWRQRIEDLEKVLEFDPDNLTALERSSGYYLYRDVPKSLELAQRFVALAPNHAQAHMRLAQALGRTDANPIVGSMRNIIIPPDTSLALQHFARAIELAPKAVDVHHARGKFYRQIGQYDRAVVDFNRALELQPDYYEALSERAAAYGCMSQYDKALADLETYLKFRPHDWIAYRDRGFSHLKLGNWRAAVDAYDRALELNPSHYALLKRRAAAHVKLGQYDEALADVRLALDLKPKDTTALWRFAYFAEIDLSQTPRDFQHGLLEIAAKVVDKSPDPAGAIQDRVQLYLALGEWKKAQADLEKALESHAIDHSTRHKHALLCLILNEAPKYRDACAAMVREFVETDSAKAANSVAWTCAFAPNAVDDYQPVLECATKAVEARPESDQFLNTLGAILYRAGHDWEALEWLSEVAQNRTSDTGTSAAYTWCFLALAHKKAGNDEQALEYLDKANAWTDKGLADEEDWPTATRHAILELLRKEAEMVVAASDEWSKQPGLRRPEPTGDVRLSLSGPYHWVLHCRRAWRLATEENWSEAVDAFSEAIELRPDRWELWKGRGEALERLDHWEEAFAAYEKAIELRPEEWLFWKGRAESFAAAGQPDKALALYASLIEHHSDDFGLWQACAALNVQRQQWEKAIEAYSHVIKLRPDDVVAWLKRAKAYEQTGDHAKAIADCTKAIRLAPNNHALYALRAGLHFKLGNYDQAIEDYTQAIKLKSDKVWMYLFRAEAYVQTGDYSKAMKDCDQAVKLDPESVWVALIRAQTLLLAQRPAEYREACANTLDRFGQSDEPDQYCHAARVCVLAANTVSDPTLPVELAARAVPHYPEKVRPWHWVLYTLGMAHFRAGQLDEAAQRFRDSLEGAPEGASNGSETLNWLGLGLVEQARGNTKEAQSWLAQAIALMERHPGPTPQDRLESKLLRRELELALKEASSDTENTIKKTP